MDTVLLKHLGVNEKLIEAIQKSYGDSLEELEISQDQSDLRLVLKRPSAPNFRPHVLTVHGFFEKKSFTQLAEAEAEYHVEKHKCKDVLEFFADPEPGKPNIRLNGVTLVLGDSLYRLLYHLASELKKTQRGWVFIQDLQDKGIIRSDGYQPFSRLRSAVAGYLLKKNSKDFIESSGLKQYRLSLDPENVFIHNGVKECLIS